MCHGVKQTLLSEREPLRRHIPLRIHCRQHPGCWEQIMEAKRWSMRKEYQRKREEAATDAAV